jgi:hypothetical protein
VPKGLSFQNPLFKSATGSETGYVDLDGATIPISDIPPWLRGRMTREQAESALDVEASLRGDFLVRESPSDGAFVLTVKLDRGTFEHHKLKRMNGSYYLMNGKPLKTECLSLLDVVRHLARNKDQTTVLLNFSDRDLEASSSM